MKYVTLCKRTGDPKLTAIEVLLDNLRIAHRRNGESWHAPILEVQERDIEKAWGLLSKRDKRWGSKHLDDVRDDAPCWSRIIDEAEQESLDTARFGWAGRDGTP
jgi:hypothetical protein